MNFDKKENVAKTVFWQPLTGPISSLITWSLNNCQKIIKLTSVYNFSAWSSYEVMDEINALQNTLPKPRDICRQPSGQLQLKWSMSKLKTMIHMNIVKQRWKQNEHAIGPLWLWKKTPTWSSHRGVLSRCTTTVVWKLVKFFQDGQEQARTVFLMKECTCLLVGGLWRNGHIEQAIIGAPTSVNFVMKKRAEWHP